MISTKLTDPEATNLQVSDVARLAVIHVRYGECPLPAQIADALAKDYDTVRLTVLRATAHGAVVLGDVMADRDGQALTRIDWPAGVTGGKRVTVSCDRGGRVVRLTLPDLEDTARHLAADDTGAATVEAPAVELVPAVPVEAPQWPGAAELAAGETTEVLTAVIAPVHDDVVDVLDPLYAERLAAAIGAVDGGSVPSPFWSRLLAPWFLVLGLLVRVVDEVAVTVRLSARWELDHARTVAPARRRRRVRVGPGRCRCRLVAGVSAPTTPQRVMAMLPQEVSPTAVPGLAALPLVRADWLAVHQESELNRPCTHCQQEGHYVRWRATPHQPDPAPEGVLDELVEACCCCLWASGAMRVGGESLVRRLERESVDDRGIEVEHMDKHGRWSRFESRFEKGQVA